MEDQTEDSKSYTKQKEEGHNMPEEPQNLTEGAAGGLKKPEEPPKPKLLTLQIISADGHSKIHFKMKITTHLVKLKKAYCNQMGIELAGLRFVFDGRRIQDDDTPLELEMDDDDQIEVYQQQIGGGIFFMVASATLNSMATLKEKAYWNNSTWDSSGILYKNVPESCHSPSTNHA